jgi:cytochrome bd-type quinol oxidase subunit 1
MASLFFTLCMIISFYALLGVGLFYVGARLFRSHPDKAKDAAKMAGGMLMDWMKKR